MHPEPWYPANAVTGLPTGLRFDELALYSWNVPLPLDTAAGSWPRTKLPAMIGEVGTGAEDCPPGGAVGAGPVGAT